MSYATLNPQQVAEGVLFLAAMIAALIATVALIALAVPRWRDSRAARLPNAAWVALACGAAGALLMRLPGRELMSPTLRVPSWLYNNAIINGAAMGLGLLLLSAVVAHIAWAASGRSIAGLRRRVFSATLAAVVPVAIAAGPLYAQGLRVDFWQSLAPRTPFGVVERIEFRVDGEGTLATWTDRATVTKLVALCPWTDRGLGYAFRCTEGSPFHLIFITESGEELDVILAVDACPTSEPAWRNHKAGWTTPVLLTRVGELLADEPAARAYAEQFDGDERDYRARWTYWARDPWGVHSED